MAKVEKNGNVDKYSSDISSAAHQHRMSIGSSKLATSDYHSELE